MGLDTSHNCWHGAYPAFGRWRKGLAHAAGIPLMLMERYYTIDSFLDGPPDERAMEWAAPREGGPECQSHYGPLLYRWITNVTEWLPIKWESLKPDVLHILLDHSDCDGWIPAEHCAALADRLTELLPLLPTEDDWGHLGNWQTKTQTFIDGLRDAAAHGEQVDFH